MRELNNRKKDKKYIFVDYFTSLDRIDVTDKNYESAMKLDKSIEVYNSSMPSISKYLEIKKLYSSSQAMKKEYNYLREFNYDSRVDYLLLYVDQISEFMEELEKEMTKDKEKEYSRFESNRYVDDYRFAAMFVNDFINYEESPYITDFIESVGILRCDFERFLEIVYELDEDLYQKYLEKANENRTRRRIDVVYKLNNIHSGIETGFTSEGEKFDFVEFYRNVPFIDQDSSQEAISDFGLRKMANVDQRIKAIYGLLFPNDLKKFTDYIYGNKLLYQNINYISEDTIKNTKYIINDVELSLDDKEEIINFMKAKQIPFISQAFNAVKHQYVTEGLTRKERALIK